MSSADRTPSLSPAQTPAATYRMSASTSSERRRAIVATLDAVSATRGDALAERFGVSRQAIVHDIAVLRASGIPIVATVRGYVLAPPALPDRARAVVAVRHSHEDATRELAALVDAGVRVVDVVVEHAVYGELRVALQIGSHADIEAWDAATREASAPLLSALTDGVHLHTIEADTPERLDAAVAELGQLGYVLAPARSST